MPSHPDHFNDCEIINLTRWKDGENASLAELVYAADLKSAALLGLWDRDPQEARFYCKVVQFNKLETIYYNRSRNCDTTIYTRRI
jgi:hypothetical protein